MIKPMSTAEGQDRKGHVYLLLAFIQPIVYQMAPGWGQVAVGSLALLVLALLSYKTVGNIPPAQAEIVKQKIEEMEADELLTEGRE